jgi:sulfur carrier protein
MKLTVNGNETEVPDNIGLLDLLKHQEVKMPEMVTVEINGDILDRAAFETTTLSENDKVEFLYFMGGGSLS